LVGICSHEYERSAFPCIRDAGGGYHGGEVDTEVKATICKVSTGVAEFWESEGAEKGQLLCCMAETKQLWIGE